MNGMLFACSLASSKMIGRPDSLPGVDVLMLSWEVYQVHTVFVIRAYSLAEAEARAHAHGIERWPVQDGWQNHSEEVIEIGRSFIEQAC